MSDYAATLQFLSSLIWPLFFIWIVFNFRPQFEKLLHRLASIKFPGGEAVFQKPSSKALQVNEEVSSEISLCGPDGFYTKAGIRELVAKSSQLPSSDEVTGELLMFDTTSQHTWLVATTKKMFILLDDDYTRDSGLVIQSVLNKKKSWPLEFDTEKGEGIVCFGTDDTYWYYSTKVFPVRKDIRNKVKRLLDNK